MRAFDLCSGIGGFRQGAELSEKGKEFKFVAYSDSDPYANTAYSKIYNVDNEVCLNDIQLHTRFSEELELIGILPERSDRIALINQSIPDFDFLFAGFPCQPHSLMGNRKGTTDLRGNIFYDIVEIIKAKQPEYFLLENVKALTSVNNGAFFNEIKDILRNHLGYNLQVWSLNAADYGVPQTRRRIFIAGSKNKPFLADDPIKEIKELKYPTTWHLLEKQVDDRYFLSENILKTILKDEHKGYKRKAEINKLIARPLVKSMHKMHRASQDNYYSEDFIAGNFDEVSGTVIPANISNPRIRRLTPFEAFKIQSFTDETASELVASGLSDTRLYMLAGNAVPPLLVKSVINHMFK